jgi:hypothetical protein
VFIDVGQYRGINLGKTVFVSAVVGVQACPNWLEFIVRSIALDESIYLSGCWVKGPVPASIAVHRPLW